MKFRRDHRKYFLQSLFACVSVLSLIFSVIAIMPVEANQDGKSWIITTGTTEKYGYKKYPGHVGEERAGFRLHCAVSHIAYDDPIVFPNQPGAAHLHTFINNTAANAFTTESNMLDGGKSTCEGGAGNLSSYWFPTVLLDGKRPIMPDLVQIYYKGRNDVNKLNPVPNNYQSIAKQSIPGCGNVGLNCNDAYANPGTGHLRMHIGFPNCLKVNPDGSPVIKSANNDHAVAGYQKCPDNYPYRIPWISINLDYKIQYSDNWVLASDIMDPSNPLPKGSTIHGDIITNWDDDARKFIVECNKAAINCSGNHRKVVETDNKGNRNYEHVHYIGEKFPLGEVPAVLSDHSHHGMNQALPEPDGEQNQEENDHSDHDHGQEEEKQPSDNHDHGSHDHGNHNETPATTDESQDNDDSGLSEDEEELLEVLKEVRDAIEKLNNTIADLKDSIFSIF